MISPIDRLGNAFALHAYPWLAAGEPLTYTYRRWIDTTPDLCVGVNALLAARARARAQGNEKDAAQLRADLAQLGIVLHDTPHHQHWRRAADV